MNDYMRALHQRFCREPECEKVRAELERAYHILRQKISQPDHGMLLRIADLEIEIREEPSLTSFIAGFQLGMGIAGEPEPYSFEDEDERRAVERFKARHPRPKN